MTDPTSMHPFTLASHAGRDPERFLGAVNTGRCSRASTILFPTVADLERGGARRARRLELWTAPTAHRYRPAGGSGNDRGSTGGVCRAVRPHRDDAPAAGVDQGRRSRAGDRFEECTGRRDDFAIGSSRRFGVDVSYYDPLAGAAIAAEFRPNTRVVFTESPGSLTFEVQDIPAIAEVAHRHGAWVVIDNTWATPFFFPVLRARRRCVGARGDQIHRWPFRCVLLGLHPDQ